MELSIQQKRQLKLYPDRKPQLIGIAIIFALLLGILGFDVYTALTHQFYEAVGIALAVFINLVVCWILMLRPFFRPVPTLMIDSRGLTYTAGLDRQKLILWEDIQSIYACKGHVLLVEVQKQQGGVSKFSRLKKSLPFHQQNLSQPIPQILQYIRETYGEELQMHDVQVHLEQ